MAITGKSEVKGYCDSLFTELSDMKTSLHCFIDEIGHVKGVDRETRELHTRHLKELIETVGWKIDILTKLCPYDWRGVGDDFDSTVSVKVSEGSRGNEEVSGGYIGG